MTEKTPSQLLQEARALIAAGHCRGRSHTVSRGHHYYCLVGALGQAALGTARSGTRPSVTNLLETIAARRWGGEILLTSYNDHMGKEAVLSLLDEALTEVTK